MDKVVRMGGCIALYWLWNLASHVLDTMVGCLLLTLAVSVLSVCPRGICWSLDAGLQTTRKRWLICLKV